MGTRPRLAPLPPPTRHRRPPIIRSALLVLVAYALGLVPFYFLTPVHQAVPSLLAQPTAVVAYVAPPIRPSVTAVSTSTPSSVEIQKRVGADTISVVAPTPNVAVVPTVVPSATVAPSDSRYAFLLLGYGGEGHDGAYLTDSMMVVVVNPDAKTLGLISLPRDTWAPLLFDGKTPVYNKINTAYAFAMDQTLYPDRLDHYDGTAGAGVFTTDTVSRLLGVPIRYYLGLDFAGFRQMINDIGGIDVNVPTAFAAQYPVNDDPSINASWEIIRFAAGPQHMTGERAIEYARARETIDNSGEGTDFARSRRQRLIIEAFKQRMFQPGGLIHLPQILSTASSHVATNYGVPDVAKLSQLALDWKDVQIYQTALTAQNYLDEATGPDGTYTLVPAAPNQSWSQIRAFGKRFWQDPATGAAMSQIEVIVENDTGIPGAAAQVTSALDALGYVTGTPVTGTTQAHSSLIDRSSTHAGQTLANALASDLHLKSIDVTIGQASDVDQVILELGSNDVGATDVPLTVDASAPVSSVGIEKVGEWDPNFGQPVELPTATTPISSTTSLATRHRTVTPVRTGTALPELNSEGTPLPQKFTPVPVGSGTPIPRLSGTPVPLQSGAPVPLVSGTAVSLPSGTSVPAPSGAPVSTPTPLHSSEKPTPPRIVTPSPPSNDQHSITETVKAIAIGDSLPVSGGNLVAPGQR